MNLAVGFTRALFTILSVIFMTVYMVAGEWGDRWSHLGMGLLLGLSLGALLIGFDLLFRRFNLRSLNIALVGLFVGYLLGQALLLVFSAILDISAASIQLAPRLREILEISLFLFGLYLGTLMTIRASDEFYLSIPFVRLASTVHHKKDLILDPSLLSDARIIDLASSGLFDHCFVLPRFVIKDLYVQMEVSDEALRLKAKKALEVAKKLESCPSLALRYNETDFPEVKDLMAKLLRLARLIDANIFTADLSKMQIAQIDGVRVLNIHHLSHALKPLTQAGERIKIKIQRYGKEPRQGVGYLEDGTMIVVNGGGQYLGETIDAQVLSVKHTSAGRMIFCNIEDGYPIYPHEHEE